MTVFTEISPVDEFSSLLLDFKKLGYIDVEQSDDLMKDSLNSDELLDVNNDGCVPASYSELYGIHSPCTNVFDEELIGDNSNQSDMVNIGQILGSDDNNNNHRNYCSSILKNLGDLMVSRGDFRGAMSAFKGALELSEDVNNEGGKDFNKTWHPIHLSICDVHIKQRDWKSLRMELEKKLSPKSNHQRKEKIDRALTLQRMGDAFRLENNIDESMKLYSNAYLLISDNKSNINGSCAAKLMQRIGDLNFLQNRYELAKDYYLEALRLGEPCSEEVPVSTILHKLGLVLNKLKCNDEALKIYHQAALLKTNENNTFRSKNNQPVDKHKQLASSFPFNEFDTAYQKISCLDMLKNISRIQKMPEQININKDDKNVDLQNNDEEKRTDDFPRENSYHQQQGENNKALNRVMLSGNPRTQTNQRVCTVNFSNPVVDRVQIITRLEKEKVKDYFYTRQDFNRFRQEHRNSKFTSSQSHFEYAASFLESVGRKHFKEGSYVLAIQAYARALRVKTEVLGNDHISTSDTILKIGDVYFKQRNFLKSLEAFDAVLKLRKSVHGECHLSVSMTYNKMGIVYDHLGEISKAISTHEKALEIRNSILGSQHILVGSSKQAIGLLHFKMGQFDLALKSFQETLKIQTFHFGSQKHTEIASTLISTGDTYFAMNNMNLALKIYGEALEIMRDDPIDKDDDIACILNNIGSVHIVKHDYKRAIKFFGEAMTSIQNGSKNPCIIIKILNNFADTLAAMGETENASAAYNKVTDLKNKVKSEEKESNQNCP